MSDEHGPTETTNGATTNEGRADGTGDGLSAAERAVVERGREWIREHETELEELLVALVARPSVTGAEGTADDPETTVGHLHEFLADRIERAELTTQRLTDVGSASEPRDNCYAVLEGESDELLVCTSHTDTVPPGDSTDWPNDDPYELARGVVRRPEPETLELRVGDRVETRSIRGRYDRIWRRRAEGDDRGGGESSADEREVFVGRGAYDNKASIVCLVGSLLALEAALGDDAELDGTLVHGHLVGEEVAQEGAKAMVGRKGYPDWLGDRYPDPSGAAVVLEGSYGFVPAIGHRGLAWISLRAEGESTHASTPHLGRNAVLGTAEALAGVRDRPFRNELVEPFREDELLGDLTVAAGTTIAGGDVRRVEDGVVDRGGVNSVPDWCETTFDVRFPRWASFPDDLESVRDHLETTIESQAADRAPDVEFEAEIDPEEFFPPVAVAASEADSFDHPLVATAIDAARGTFGYDPGVTVAPGVTDAASIYHGTRLPTLVEYGPAGAWSHEPLEFVEREQVVRGAEALLEFAVRRLGLSERETDR
ncbi:M20 family metallopeptidase [Natrialba swarupiae]|uniref:M20 family metallopeptidase n=1 Tax=Natrialba swarupiae TaxID=2448032 RepID=A0A5D5AKY0_9EURY|nr:M20/M25/M40 family metallo-hydrolase [Natrialba swarupiae]TYT61605.1 M20 family metallopeptidase [Natrialba swarupiae]